MILHQFLVFKDHCDRVFNSDDTERDFRSRMVGGLAVLVFAFASALTIDDLSGGHLAKGLLLAAIPAGAACALWLLMARGKLDAAAATLVGSLLTVLSALILLSGGTLAGGFVALPVLVLLASVACTRVIAVIVTVVAISVSAIAMWLSTTDWDFPLAISGSALWLLGRISIVISLVTMVAIFLYRDSAEHIRNRANEIKFRLERTNSDLSSLLQAHLSTAQLMFKVQEIGNLVGWWYEPATGDVHYTASENGEFRKFRLGDPEGRDQAPQFLGANFRDLVLRRVREGVTWDDEACIEGDDGDAKWYRDSGEVELEHDVVVRVVGVLQDVTSTKNLTDRLELQANYDELTGLCNRRMFWKAVEVEHADFKNRNVMSHLLLIDIDQFKLVNDTSGYVAGDRLLQIVARVLQDNVHDRDIVARVGGDEFGLIVRDCSPATIPHIADRLREAIEQVHFHWSGETFRVGASVGVIGIDPANGGPGELQQLVDAACYEAKLEGRNRVNFFEGGEEMIAAHRGEARWVQKLHDAMSHDRFELHGQLIKPVVENGEPDRYEILIRLRDDENDRLIPPGAFLPAAERFGLSSQLDQWVIEHVLKELHACDDPGSVRRKYWINLSGNSVGDKKFADYLVETMRNSTLPKGMINFEITETAVIRNIETAGGVISSLRAMGCQFALDDFGSGLSSFGYLKKLPVDYLKIDGMFVREIINDESDRVFVQAIINIAQSMGIKTVAEFVENDEIFQIVEEFGVDYVQGYGIHRPERMVFHDVPGVADRAAHSTDSTARRAS